MSNRGKKYCESRSWDVPGLATGKNRARSKGEVGDESVYKARTDQEAPVDQGRVCKQAREACNATNSGPLGLESLILLSTESACIPSCGG